MFNHFDSLENFIKSSQLNLFSLRIGVYLFLLGIDLKLKKLFFAVFCVSKRVYMYTFFACISSSSHEWQEKMNEV